MNSIIICDDTQRKFIDYVPNKKISDLLKEKKKEYEVDCITTKEGRLSFLESTPDEFQQWCFNGNYFLIVDDNWSLYNGKDAKADLIDAIATGSNKVFIVLYSTNYCADDIDKHAKELEVVYKNNCCVRINENGIGFSETISGFRYLSRNVIELLPVVEDFFNG